MNTTTAIKAGRGAQLNVDQLLERARKKTGLTDFGDPWFLHPLTHLVELVNTDGGLVSDDIYHVHAMVNYLADRLQTVAYVKQHPEVRNEKLDIAGVIIGLPRGGSTLLQRLISTSPQLTSTKMWEVRYPIPEPSETRGNPVGRVAKTQADIDRMYAEWPDMKSQHPMTAEGYDEEVLLLDRTFLSIDYSHYFNIPSYDHWQLHQDHSKAYDELKLWLQILQYNSPERKGKRWFLKSPHHLFGAGLHPMLKTFPGAKAVMTHRTLESVIASYCSLQASTIQNYSNNFDKSKSGNYVVAMFKEALETMIAVRKQYPADRFIDVKYADVIANPLVQFRRTLELMGLKVTPEDEKAATTWMSQNGRDSHPRHKYTPEDCGLTGQQIADTFKFYHDAFVK